MASTKIRQCLHDVSFYLLLLVFLSTLGPLQFGFHLAELNAPQDVLTCKKKAIKTTSTASKIGKWFSSRKPEHEPSPGFLPDCIPMNEAAFATVSSIFTLGGLAGALCAGPFASRRGRLPAMRLAGVIFIIGGIIETIAGSVPVLAGGRFTTGLGAGAATVVVPLYISEIAPPAQRGLFGTATQLMINKGILLTQTLGYFLSYGSAWRWILATGVVISVTQTLGLFLVPESPAWLANHGDVVKARRILQRIRGKGFNIQNETAGWQDADEDATAEHEGLLAAGTDGLPAPTPATGKTEGMHLGFIQVVRDPLYSPAIVACVGIMFAQQFCGINSIIMYSVSQLTDLLPISSALLTILISVVNLVTTAACSPLPDKLGRKTCLLISIVGQGSSSLVFALSIIFGVKVVSAIAVTCFVGFFAVGLGPVPFILASELVGPEAVGATQSWCLAANYIATFLIAQFFPIVSEMLTFILGPGWIYFIFVGFALVSAAFVSWKVPETKGKKDADEVWGRTRRID